jgi:two-component system NarL family response regulator
MRVLIVDDMPRSRQSIRALLSTCAEVDSLSEAGSGLEALQSIALLRPDAVVMDICMVGMDGLAATRSIKAAWPQVRVVVLSLCSDCEEQALAAGADAFVSKGDPPARLLEALDVAGTTAF